MITPLPTIGSSLAQEQRDLTRSRILRGAMEMVGKKGFDATIEDIARCCGISERTIFRHYASHDRLMLATVKALFEACGQRPVAGPPSSTEDLDGWLTGLAEIIHTRNAEILGEAFWDIHAPSHTDRDVLREMASLSGEHRRQGVDYLVALAWRSAGGTGTAPEHLRLAFALHLSAFTTQALMVDFHQTPRSIGVLTAGILKVLLCRAVEEQGPIAQSENP